MLTVANLPDDILYLIGSEFEDGRSDLYTLGKVSRNLYQLVLPLLFKHISDMDITRRRIHWLKYGRQEDREYECDYLDVYLP